MTMQTMLSDGEMVQRRKMHFNASDSTPFSVHFLIANARLEFSVSHRKDSPLRIPNRERIAILHLRSHALARKGQVIHIPQLTRCEVTTTATAIPCGAVSTRAILEASSGELRMRVCDGCGAPADEAHVRKRIERLEMATRFRPIHIQVLLLGDAPPIRTEDYFYRPLRDGESRSAGAKNFFIEMLNAASIAPDAAANDEAALAEFQRRGFHLADAIECPVATPEELSVRVTGASSTVLKRIEFSYRPKHVVPIGAAVKALIPLLQRSSFGDRLVVAELASRRPDALATSGAQIATTGAQIAAALAHLA